MAKGASPVSEPLKIKSFSYLPEHLNNGVRARADDLGVGVERAEMAVVQAAQCGSLRQVVGELVGHLIQNGVSGAKFIQDSFVVGSLGIDGVQRTVKLKGAGGPGGIGGVGVKIPAPS